MSVPTREHIRSMSASFAHILSPFSDKRIARAAEAHPKTAARWRRGEAAPTGEALLRMMASDDELFAAFLLAAGRADHAAQGRAAGLLKLALQEMGG